MNTRFRDQHIPLRGFPAWWKTLIQSGVEMAVGIMECVCSEYSLTIKKCSCDVLVRREMRMGGGGCQHREGARARRKTRRKCQWTFIAFHFAFPRLRGSLHGGCGSWIEVPPVPSPPESRMGSRRPPVGAPAAPGGTEVKNAWDESDREDWDGRASGRCEGVIFRPRSEWRSKARGREGASPGRRDSDPTALRYRVPGRPRREGLRRVHAGHPPRRGCM